MSSTSPFRLVQRMFPLRLTKALTGDKTAPAGFALVACQRAGTHLMVSVLNSHPEVAVVSEPFTPLTASVHWHNFIRTLPEDKFPPANRAAALSLVDDYLGMIRHDAQEDNGSYGGPKREPFIVGLDIKYNQLHTVNPVYRDLRAQPILLDYFRSRQFRIVHLVRNNLVHTAISLIVAQERGVWVNRDGTSIEGKYRIPPADLIARIRWIEEERQEFQRLAKHLPLQTCVYEDLVDDLGCIDADGNFPTDTTTLRPLSTFLGISNQFRYTGRDKKVINKPYAEIIENFGELVRAVENSEYAEFAGTLDDGGRPARVAA